MSLWRSLWFLSFASLSLPFTAAYWRQSAPATAPPPVYPVRPDPAAAQALKRAITELDSDKMPGLQTKLWQQVCIPPLTYEATGTFLSGTEHRLRIELEVQSKGKRRQWRRLSDGQTLWEAERVGEGEWSISQLDLTRLRATLSDVETTAAARADSLLGQLALGPALLLKTLRRDVTFTCQQQIRWHNRDVLLLSGVRSSAVNQEWPAYTARQCRLVLDAETFWPHHIEWWGPAPSATGDIRLVQLEFRQPLLKQPIADQVFTFSPQNAPVVDCTEQWLEKLRQPSR